MDPSIYFLKSEARLETHAILRAIGRSSLELRGWKGHLAVISKKCMVDQAGYLLPRYLSGLHSPALSGRHACNSIVDLSDADQVLEVYSGADVVDAVSHHFVLRITANIESHVEDALVLGFYNLSTANGAG